MTGYVTLFDGDSFGFHADSPFPNVPIQNVKEIQLDGDELAFGLRLWPSADAFAPPGHVRVWVGAQARRFTFIFQEYKRGADS